MKVYAFEPNAESVAILRRNAQMNQVTVDVSEVALGASNGTARFAPFGGTSRITPDGEVQVPVRSLDSFGLARVDVLKVDFEGYELEVMKGAVETLRRCRPTMMIEMHHWLGADGEAHLFGILKDAGYSEYLDRYAMGRHLVAFPGRTSRTSPALELSIGERCQSRIADLRHRRQRDDHPGSGKGPLEAHEAARGERIPSGDIG